MDFFGSFLFEMEASILRGIRIRFLGQATVSSVDELDLKVFCREIDDYTQGKGRAVPLVNVPFRESRTPLMGIYMTASSFTRDARAYAATGRCILLDGTTIAEFVSRTPALGEWIGSSAERLGTLVSDLSAD